MNKTKIKNESFNWNMTFQCKFCYIVITTKYCKEYYCTNCNTLLRDSEMLSIKDNNSNKDSETITSMKKILDDLLYEQKKEENINYVIILTIILIMIALFLPIFLGYIKPL